MANEFGGAMKLCLCGGAQVNPEVVDYMQIVMYMKIFQGYGQTEGIGANIVSPVDTLDSSSVGIPFITTQCKIIADKDIPENSYHLFLRGPAIMEGYYNQPELTKKAFTSDGWLITGDIVTVKDNMFYITARSKDIFKTSFGEYITPEKVENEFIGEMIEDIFILGSAKSDYLLAIVVCSDMNYTLQDVASKIKQKGNHLISQNRISRFEVPAHFILLREPFANFDNGNLFTPSFKKKRNAITEYFNDDIEKAFKKRI